ncbi:hypothetical protein KSF78_0004421 [Schistosoma japonicum]|nr:hypothetical protein KSF78_0004421 [Schistosoma japonicum]KAH8869565.1 hypothetical protein KSF78_0004421 [Schistosoma japonicum]KAH8869566.1 hypothetical protein KSF78_0004421 [Schistosoma japonicum]KAH8869567.1 hypothetical protein KSF78_0004421 [Schistosoma japonicum]
MDKAVALFKNPDFSIKELIYSLYLDTLLIRQCFQAKFILLDSKYDNKSNCSTRMCPTNLFILQDNQRINVPSLLTTSNTGNITSWTYSPFTTDENIDWLPNLIIHQTPLLVNIPLSPINASKLSIRWLICLRLTIGIQDKTNWKGQFIASLHPHVINSSITSISWLSPKIVINLQHCSNEQITLNLFAYTSNDIFYNNHDYITTDNNYSNMTTIHLGVNFINNSNSCNLHLFNPFKLSFSSFIHNYYHLHNYFSIMSSCMILKPINLLPSCIYPYCKQWTLVNHVTDQCISYSIANQQLINNIIESILNEFCIWHVYKVNKCIFYLITNGIFNGLCLYVNGNYSSSSPWIIEIYSGSPKLLHLFDQVLLTRNSVNDFSFIPYTRSLELNCKSNVQCSITNMLNCLINETEYLINQITQLIECTMRKRIPDLSIFLQDLTNNLDIAHRSSEWRTIVNKASSIPIDMNVSQSNFQYCQLQLQTDISVKQFCYEKFI